MTATPEEPKDQNVTVRVTASEKRAVQLLALLRDTTESDVMRSMTIDRIVADADAERRTREAA
jgi:hypothetical protein